MQALIRSKSAGIIGGRGTAGAGPGKDLRKQIAEFAALEYAVHFVSALGWDRVGLVGDNFWVLQSFAAGKASVG